MTYRTRWRSYAAASDAIPTAGSVLQGAQRRRPTASNGGGNKHRVSPGRACLYTTRRAKVGILRTLAQGDGARQADSRAMSSPSIGSTSLMMRSALSAARSGSSVTPSAMPSV